MNEELVQSQEDGSHDKNIAKLEARRRKNGTRVAKRVLKALERGQTNMVVKAGPVGLRKTIHPPETYEYAQQVLRQHDAKIDVHRHHLYVGNATNMPGHDEVVVRSHNGKELASSPIHPVKENGFDYPAGEVEKIYPPGQETTMHLGPKPKNFA